MVHDGLIVKTVKIFIILELIFKRSSYRGVFCDSRRHITKVSISTSLAKLAAVCGLQVSPSVTPLNIRVRSPQNFSVSI
jgi:hypothetical protein